MEKLADTRILEHVGLTRNESRVYIELLRAGSSLARDIARLMNMHRTSVYSCLERLQKKGLVSVTNLDKKTYFEAVDPNKLLLKKSGDLYGVKNNDDYPEVLIDSVPVPDFISNTKQVKINDYMSN